MKIKACKHHAHHSHGNNHEPLLEKVIANVRAKGLRLTPQRKEILVVLLSTERPLSAEEVYKRLKKGSSDLVTVFRSLNQLEVEGLLQKHDFGDKIRRYELRHEQAHHHHFIHCRSCGNAEAFDGCDFEKVLAKMLKNKGYKNIRHSLEVMALCTNCS